MVFVTAIADMFVETFLRGLSRSILNVAMITGVLMVFKYQQQKEVEHVLRH